MGSSQQILVRNMSANAQYFFVFQKQAAFATAPTSAIGSSSLGCQQVGNYSATGAQISFRLDAQIYAGAISTMAPLPPSQFIALIAVTPSRAAVSSSSASQPVTIAGSQPMNFTTMSINPLGLSAASANTNVKEGTFGVAVPSYTPLSPPELYCGVAVTTADGSVVLSSYVAPAPSQTLSCAPQPIYYVKLGYQPTGSLITYDTSNSAECNFSTGATSITVTYNSDGTFSTVGGP